MIERISVVIPVRNRPLQILAAIESVERQSTPATEVIVVDDGSTDNTPEIVASYHASCPLKLLRLRNNRGGGYARNAGIDAAEGTHIALLDSDDTWMPQKLEHQVKAARTHGGSDFLVFSNLHVDNCDGSPLIKWNTIDFQRGMSAREYLMQNFQVIQTSTLLLPAPLAKRIRFDERLRRHQDIDFVLRLEQAGAHLIYLPEALVRYTSDKNAERVSARKSARPSLEWMKVAEGYLPKKHIAKFYCKHVFDLDLMDDPLSACMRAGAFVCCGLASPLPFIKTILRLSTPERIKNLIR